MNEPTEQRENRFRFAGLVQERHTFEAFRLLTDTGIVKRGEPLGEQISATETGARSLTKEAMASMGAPILAETMTQRY